MDPSVLRTLLAGLTTWLRLTAPRGLRHEADLRPGLAGTEYNIKLLPRPPSPTALLVSCSTPPRARPGCLSSAPLHCPLRILVRGPSPPRIPMAQAQRPQVQPCRYKTGKTLGAGSYSVVKECVHIDTGRYYAAKVINKRLMAGREHMVGPTASALVMPRVLLTVACAELNRFGMRSPC